MGSNRLVSLLVVVVLAGAGAYFLFPGLRTKVNDTVKGWKAWDDEARRKDPVGFIDHARKTLEENVSKFEEARTSLRAASMKLEDMQKEQQGKHAFAEKSLDAFKAAYKEASGGKGWPATVAGRAYKEGELKSQVNVLLSQRDGYAKSLAQIKAALDRAEKSGNEILDRITMSKTQLDVLGTQRELVKVGQLTAETEKMMSQVQDVLRANEALAEKPTVRTVEEMMKDAGEAPGAANPNVDAFLNG